MTKQHSSLVAGAALAFALWLQPACNAAEPFTVVLLPDTQFYSASASLITNFSNQTQWIVDNRASSNIVMVSHVGDVVNSGGDLTQWGRADAAMDILDSDTNLAYGVVLGNHDYAGGATPNDDASNFITYFGASRWAERSWYGGASPDGRNQYHTFRAGGREYLHLLIEYWGASPANSNAAEVIDWAQDVLDDHPTTPTILSTHEYLSGGGGRTAPGNDIFNALVKANPQVFMVLCGHWHGEAHPVAQNDEGKDVFQILANFQSGSNGGDGWMTMLSFDENNNVINATTYSPSLDQYQTDANSQYALSMNFSERFDLGSGPLMGAPTVAEALDDGARLQCRVLNADADAVTLVWAEADQGATSVDAWTSAEGGGMYAFGAATNGSVPTRTVTGLDGDMRYSFRFMATSGADEDWSAEGTFATGLAALPAPTDLAGADVYGTRVELTWTENYATETGFVIQRSSDPSFSVVDAYTVGADQTDYSDRSVDANSTYYYRVAAEGSTGIGVLSSGIVVSTTAGAPSLIGHWKFDEGAGLTAADSSINGNTATSESGTWVAGRAGQAFDNPRFTLADSSDLNRTGAVPVTVSVWVKPHAAHGNTCFAGFEGTGNSGDIYALKTSSDKIQFYPSGITTPSTLMSYSDSGSNWVHVVGVHDSDRNESTIYIDGSAVVTGNAGAIPTRDNVEFTMGKYWNSTYHFNGVLDDVQVYDQALSYMNVLELFSNPGYALGDAPPIPPEAISMDPADNSTVGPPAPASLTITFDRAIVTNSAGFITLTNLTAHTADIIPVGSTELAVNVATLSITPLDTIADSSHYAVLIGTNAIRSASSGAFFAGYTDPSEWDFTTVAPDLTPPSAVPPFAPVNGTTEVSPTANLVVMFDEPIQAGAGNIVLTNLTDGTATPIAASDSSQVSIDSGTNLTINPTANLLHSKQYAVLVETNAITDASGNFFGGISSSATWRFTIRDAGLIGHWTFDEGAGTTAADSSLNGNTATTSSGTWISGKAGQAFENPTFTLGDSSDLYTQVGAVPFTISVWTKPSAANGGALVGFEGYGSNGDIYALKMENDRIKLTPAGTTTPDTLMNYSASGSNWVHVVGVNEPGVNSRIYIDGQEVKNGGVGSIPAKTTVQFTMGIYWTGDYGYKGALDDVQVYDIALSDADVLYLFNNPGYALGGAPPAGTVFILR